MTSLEFKNGQKASSYQDYEDHKRIFFIYSETLAYKNGEDRILNNCCGMGNISRAMGALGFNVHGLDLDPGPLLRSRPIIHFQKKSNSGWLMQTIWRSKQSNLMGLFAPKCWSI